MMLCTNMYCDSGAVRPPCENTHVVTTLAMPRDLSRW